MSRYKTIILGISAFLYCVVSQHSPVSLKPLDPDYQYPISYKDHVYTSLSQSARDLFFAINIHPSCVEKKGQCIQRGKCIEKKMLYISRICYMRDLVCCYVDYVKNPVVEHITKYPPPTKPPHKEE